MKQIIMTKGISGGSLFRLLSAGFFSTIVPFAYIAGLLSLFGAETVHINGQPMTGTSGLLASLIIGPVIALLFSVFAWLPCVVGQWIYCKFHTLPIKYTPAQREEPPIMSQSLDYRINVLKEDES